jgi:hypothetical protein
MNTESTPTLAAVVQPRLVRQFRRLEMGEIVLATDEIYDDHKRAWVEPEWSVGKPAPDPAYTSHRQFRREINSLPNTSSPDQLSR